MNKIILLLLALFTASVIAAETVPTVKRTWTTPTIKVVMPRTKKRQMNIYYASRANEIDNSESDTGADDLDIHVGYRRPELAYGAATPEVDTIPDDILQRLVLARAAAVQRHREIWC